MKIFWGNEPWIRGAAYYLRYKVFVLEQGISPLEEFDELDDDKRIYGVCLQEDLPVATIRYQKDSEIQVHPDRLCVLAKKRSTGLGAALLTALEKRSIAEGCRQAVLSAEVEAVEFYEKLGYQVVSEPFFEDGILCVRMKKVF